MKKLVSLMLVLALVLGIATSVSAVVETADIKVSLDKTTAKVGDEITVTVDWTEVMEAVDLELGFDKTKVEFVSSSISEDYIATDRVADGVVQISWFSMNGQGITKITYKFKVIAEGTAKFTTAEAVLADSNVESPADYKYGTATLTVAKVTTGNTNNTTNTNTPSTNNTTNTNTPSTNNTTNTNTPSKNNTTNTNTPSKNNTTNTNTPTKNTTTNTTTKPSTIPQAGVNMIECAIVALVAIIAVSLVAVVVKSKRK